VRAEVQNEGAIAQRKGINLPASIVSAPAVTDKDKEDALFAVQQNIDMIAMSFVRKPQDVLELKEVLASVGASIPIIAKIEKPQALHNLRGILEVSWGVMVARGDLGVELSPEEVPMAQKRIIREALRVGRPVITATQMLDSMTRNPRPTRAEASDVANAVLDGTDAVMLSGETANGKYPVESIHMMERIIEVTERALPPEPQARRRERGLDTSDKVIIDAGCTVAYQLHAHAIVAFTVRGNTAVLASQRRPATAIIAFTPRPEIRNLLAVVWGVQPHMIVQAATTERVFEELDAALLAAGLAERGDRLVVMMSSPKTRHGPTNVMTVHHVGQN
jgi:pyruvate kinase